MSKDCSQHVEAIGKGISLLNGAKAGNGTESFQERQHFRVGFSSAFHLQYQLCYTHRQYFDSFGNFTVFYPNITILCIFQILGLRNRPFTLGTLFFQT